MQYAVRGKNIKARTHVVEGADDDIKSCETKCNYNNQAVTKCRKRQSVRSGNDECAIDLIKAEEYDDSR